MEKQLIIKIDGELRNKFKSICAGKGSTMTDEIIKMIKSFIKES